MKRNGRRLREKIAVMLCSMVELNVSNGLNVSNVLNMCEVGAVAQLQRGFVRNQTATSTLVAAEADILFNAAISMLLAD